MGGKCIILQQRTTDETIELFKLVILQFHREPDDTRLNARKSDSLKVRLLIFNIKILQIDDNVKRAYVKRRGFERIFPSSPLFF